jgi:hypothetical protein
MPCSFSSGTVQVLIFDFLSQLVDGTGGYRFLRHHNARPFRPIMSYPFSDELYPYGVYNPVGEQAKEDMCLGGIVFPVVNRAQIQVQLQCPECVIHITDYTVIFPDGFFTKTHAGSTQVINARRDVCFFSLLYLPVDPDSGFVPGFLFNVYFVMLLFGGVFLCGTPDSLQYLVVFFDSMLPVYGGFYHLEALLEAGFELPVHASFPDALAMTVDHQETETFVSPLCSIRQVKASDTWRSCSLLKPLMKPGERTMRLRTMPAASRYEKTYKTP